MKPEQAGPGIAYMKSSRSWSYSPRGGSRADQLGLSTLQDILESTYEATLPTTHHKLWIIMDIFYEGLTKVRNCVSSGEHREENTTGRRALRTRPQHKRT